MADSGMMDANIVSILLDIKEQNGCMGSQLHEAARQRERVEEALKLLGQKVDTIEYRTDVIEVQQDKVAASLPTMLKDIAKLKLLTGKFTAVWGAGFAVIGWALTYFSTEIHGYLFPPHHP
jgi:hypothetical protein